VFESELVGVEGYTLLLPAVSVGNVGQLCIDVVLENLSPPPSFSCQVLHPSLIQVVSVDCMEGLGSTLSTALQVYRCDVKKLLIFQIRSGILPGQGAVFISDLLDWFKEMNCSEMIVLGSSHAHERTDAQIEGSPLRYTSSWERTVPENFIKLESRSRFPGLISDETEDSIFIPGGGISKRILENSKQRKLSLTLLLKFCSEGDNSVDGVVLAEYLDQLVSVRDRELKTKLPASWSHLFGPPAPTQMFW